MRSSLVAPFALAAVLATGLAPAEEPAPLATDDEKILYALGAALAQQLQTLDFDARELALVQRGLADSVLGRDLAVSLEEFGPRLQSYLRERVMRLAEELEAKGVEFRSKVAAEQGALTTDSGLVYQEQQAGTGASPTADATVKIHYHGTFPDGTVFDSSRRSGEPAQFTLAGVVPCFSEGIQRMKVGGKSRLVCPPELAYGDAGIPPRIPPGSTLVFDIELLDVVAKAEPPAAEPPGTAEPPAPDP